MKRIMFFLMIAAIMAMSCTLLSSCREEGHTIELTNDYVSGTWDVTWMEIDGEGMYIPDGHVYMTIKSSGTYYVKMMDNHYTGRWVLEGNKVLGITLDPIKEVFKFTNLDGNKAEISYSNSEGLRMRLMAKKR